MWTSLFFFFIGTIIANYDCYFQCNRYLCDRGGGTGSLEHRGKITLCNVAACCVTCNATSREFLCTLQGFTVTDISCIQRDDFCDIKIPKCCGPYQNWTK